MNEKCFECGNPATENHHVVPETEGGTKTVPLCGSCHGKVHGINRPLNLGSMIKKGIDRKFRINLLASVHHLETYYEFESLDEFIKLMKSEFDYDLSKKVAQRLWDRYYELDADFLNEIMTNQVGEEFKHTWDINSGLSRIKKSREVIGSLFSLIKDQSEFDKILDLIKETNNDPLTTIENYLIKYKKG